MLFNSNKNSYTKIPNQLNINNIKNMVVKGLLRLLIGVCLFCGYDIYLFYLIDQIYYVFD